MKLCLVLKTKKTSLCRIILLLAHDVLSLCKYFNAADEDALHFVNCKCFCHRGDTFLWLGCLISTNTPAGYQLLLASPYPETKVNTRPVINTTGPSLSDTDDCQWLFLFTESFKRLQSSRNRWRCKQPHYSQKHWSTHRNISPNKSEVKAAKSRM